MAFPEFCWYTVALSFLGGMIYVLARVYYVITCFVTSCEKCIFKLWLPVDVQNFFKLELYLNPSFYLHSYIFYLLSSEYIYDRCANGKPVDILPEHS